MSVSSLRLSFPPGSRSRCLILIALLTAVIVGLVLLLNHDYFLRGDVYATGDEAANALKVLRCKKFEDYLGNYSRWGFYHPGPFLLYYLAAGEAVWWQWLHLTRTPFSAEVFSVLCLAAACFAVGVGVAARWVRSRFFVPLALLLGALHYTAVHLQVCMLDTWTAYVSTLPYFCLVVTAASVMAGQGEDLPWLMLAGCILIHIHVANPLFVLPLFALSYLGLLWAGYRETAPASEIPARLRFPWRRYPTAHWLAGGIAALFALPIIIDLTQGANSNFAQILKHLRSHQGENHPYLDAAYYLLRFGAYKPSVDGDVGVFRGTTAPIIQHFLATHLKMTLLWSGALLSPLLTLGLRSWLGLVTAAAKSAGGSRPTEPLDRARGKFLGCLLVCFTLCTMLALYWAHIQDGDMYYYNAWYIYSLYGILTLVAAIALSDAVDRIVATFRHPGWLTGGMILGCLTAAEFAIGWPRNPPRNRAAVGDDKSIHAQERTVLSALGQHPTAPRTKLLLIPDDGALGAAPGVALQLKRLGYEFRVLPRWWKVMFGAENTLPDFRMENGLGSDGLSHLEPWWIVRGQPTATGPCVGSLIDGFILKTGYSPVDLQHNAAIVFAGTGRNADTYTLEGFVDDPAATVATWTMGRVGQLLFETQPVPEDSAVEVTFEFCPPLVNAIHPVQRLQMRYNQTDLGTLEVRAQTPIGAMKVRVPGKLWNAQNAGMLRLGFPDAVAPADIFPDSKDTRLLAFSAARIVFRLVLPETTAASLPMDHLPGSK